MKNIAILGSTGSIGENTLAIVRAHPDRFRVRALAAKKNATRLAAQALEFRPELVCLYEKEQAAALQAKLSGMFGMSGDTILNSARKRKLSMVSPDSSNSARKRKLSMVSPDSPDSRGIRVVTGEEGLCEASALASVDQAIFAMVGAVGLRPLFAALRARKSVAVANKEPLVMAGGLLMKEARALGVSVLPIDSEHSALWQCLEGRRVESVKKLILTSSGGPFRKKKGSLASVKPREALKHPKWKMGPKITIDSATLMNKGLEVIEAVHLFGVSTEQVEVLIHPEAIVHAMVEFVDGSHIAQLGITDMRLPIQYALSFPERLVNHLPTLDLARLKSLHFEKPDRKRFPCLELGYEASRAGGTMPAVLNAANELAVEAFLAGQIGFTNIGRVIEKVMGKHRVKKDPSLDDVLVADRWARQEATELMSLRACLPAGREGRRPTKQSRRLLRPLHGLARTGGSQ